MDKKIASYLLASLLQRINRDQLGSVSDQEKEALAFALSSMQSNVDNVSENNLSSQDHPISDSADGRVFEALPKVDLVLESLRFSAPTDEGVLLCLDFGTAMSKAFASSDDGRHFDLELGKAAGGAGYTLPSSVFIDDEGLAYFGFEALDKSGGVLESGRERLDSIKSWLSLREEGDLDAEVLTPAYNPIRSIKLTEGDLIRVYLAFLTDMAGVSLEAGTGHPTGRYVLRRFARPCGKNVRQAAWVDALMKRLLAEAQVLADTFHGQWRGGIPVAKIKSAINALTALNTRPEYLLAEGVPEPVAVAAGAVATSENRIDAYMVVDAGAGTTDFGLFFVMRNKGQDAPKVFQVPASIKGLNQAGDKVDLLLQAFIRSKESFDPTSTLGKLIEADLRRRIRISKELLFSTGKLDYVLADSTIGTVELSDFLQAPGVKQFAERLEAGFLESLTAIDQTYIDYLTLDRVRLNIILTGGSSKLDMMSSLASGYIEVRGKRILRVSVNPMPDWMEDESKEMKNVYPQLAVAIGGASEDLPSNDFGPDVFERVIRPTYVAGRLGLSSA